MYLNHYKLKNYFNISDECVNRLTKIFNHKKFKLNISLSLLRLNKYNLAITYKKLIDDGVYKNKAELARVYGVSRAWITKVMNELKMS